MWWLADFLFECLVERTLTTEAEISGHLLARGTTWRKQRLLDGGQASVDVRFFRPPHPRRDLVCRAQGPKPPSRHPTLQRASSPGGRLSRRQGRTTVFDAEKFFYL